MKPSTRTVSALAAGIYILFISMLVAGNRFWASCSGGMDYYRDPDHEIWICSNLPLLWFFGSVGAGIAAGLLSRRRGFVTGFLVAVLGVALYSFVVHFPFGNDHLSTLESGSQFFVLPCIVGAIVGARLSGGLWKTAL
jgi:hypothetical protein